MDCICLNKRKKRKDKEKRKPSSGQKNTAYIEDEDDDILENNAVLAEMEQAENDKKRNSSESIELDDKSGSSLPDTPSHVQVTAHASNHSAQSNKKDTKKTKSFGKATTQDDQFLNHYQYDSIDVELLSKDSVGPGFSVTGTLTEGITIGALHDKGPALESGQISLGDRILSVTIGFNNMAYEDALTILSYAAPYPMTLKLARGSKNTSSSPSSEVNELNTRVYHPVYRSQSVGGGTHHPKKHRKMPSRPGTSLSQIDYATQELSNEGSQESLETSLVKDKFGNTLNLIDASDSVLHRHIDDSDTTIDDSLKSESQAQSTTSLTDTVDGSPHRSDFSVPEVSAENYPIVAEVIISEPLTPSTNTQMPPEKPKRAHQLQEEVIDYSYTDTDNPMEPLTVSVSEQEIIPIISPKKKPDLPEWIGLELTDATLFHNSQVEGLFPSGIPDVDDIDYENIEYTVGHHASPVSEEHIQPAAAQSKQESFNSYWLQNTLDSTEEDRAEAGDYNSKQQTLTVDTVKIRDPELLEVETQSGLATASEQASPNDSGIHSERTPSEYGVEEPANHQDDEGRGSSTRSSPHTAPRHGLSASSDDLMSAVLGFNNNKPTTSAQRLDEAESSAGSSQVTSPRQLSLTGLFASSYLQQPLPSIKRRRPRPRSAGALVSPRYSQPEVAVPKATSRDQLEAARARFFAELMQSSDLFKDNPSDPLTLSSESINTADAPGLSNDPFKKYTSKTLTTTNNNNIVSLNSQTSRSLSSVDERESSA